MTQPISLRWQSASRYHTAVLAPDLFGEWVLMTTSGDSEQGAGRIRQRTLQDYAEGVEAIRRLRHKRRVEGFECHEAAFSALDHLEAHHAEVRAAGALALVRLFRDWAVDATTQAALLGLDGQGLERLLDGAALADEPNLLARARHLLAINKVLRLRFAGDVEVLRDWLRQPCHALGETTPLAAMQMSLDSLASLRTRLGEASDHARGCHK